MKTTIVSELLSQNKIKFLDENNLHFRICYPSKFKYVNQFQPPFLIIDTFAKKTTRQKDIVRISLNDLKRKELVLTSVKATKSTRWISYQKRIYRIEPLFSISPNSKKLLTAPEGHKIEFDRANQAVRLIGKYAGYPHRGNGGNWVPIKNDNA